MLSAPGLDDSEIVIASGGDDTMVSSASEATEISSVNLPNVAMSSRTAQDHNQVWQYHL